MTDRQFEYNSGMMFFHLPLDIAPLYEEFGTGRAITAIEPLLEAKELDKGPGHPETLDTVNALGALLTQTGDLKGAERMFRRALAGREKALGPDSFDTETSLCNLGSLLMLSGDFRASLDCNLRLLECRRRRLPANHPGMACVMIDLGTAYKIMGEIEKAAAMFSRAVEIAEKTMQPGCNDITYALRGLSDALIALERHGDALPLLTRALKNNRRSQKYAPRLTVSLHSLHGCALALSGDSEGARKTWRKGLRAARENCIPYILAANIIEMMLGQSLIGAGELRKAVRHIGNAADGFRVAYGPENAYTVAAESRLANANLAYWIQDKGLFKLMAPELTPDDVAEGLKKAGAPEDVRNNFLGMLWLNPLSGGPGRPCSETATASGSGTGRSKGGPGAVPSRCPPGKAVRKALTLFTARKRELGPGHEDTVKAGIAFGNALMAEGRIRDATEAYTSARAAAAKSLGPGSPAVMGAEYCLTQAEGRNFRPSFW
ncbi:MAG: tetratricopeptide repeat-containing protein [Deltaproteobacteria bacterium]|jgi:tetratricopeptide (TPR) repeat protein|nr:tetratricopeptide repeat-containing protein [Deltaproteobacteria bacterium]